MKVVYLLTSGSYSDYQVHAAFENKADAESVSSRYPDGAFDVEARRLYESPPMPWLRHIITARDFQVRWDQNEDLGNGWFLGTQESLMWPWDDKRSSRPRLLNFNGKALRGRRSFTVTSDDGVEKARKVALDTVSRIRAEDEGVA